MKKRINKKAQALKIVQVVLGTLFMILIFGVIVVFGTAKLRDTADTIDRPSVSFTNVTTDRVINSTGGNVTGTTNLRKCSLSGLTISYNATNSTCSAGIGLGNFTITDCSIAFKGNGSNGQDSSCYNNTILNVTGTYTFSGETVNDVTKNISSGVSEFSENASTYFAILGIVLIVAILGILVAYALGFIPSGSFRSASVNVGGGGGGGGIISGRSAFRRSDEGTMMGV